MKIVLISIKEKYWNLILSGKKLLEIRKTAPRDIKYPFLVVCYISGRGIMGYFMCGAVVKSNFYSYLAKQSCLTEEELSKYANEKTKRHDGNLYGWAVKAGTPASTKEVLPVNIAGYVRPPQSWCYVKEANHSELLSRLGINEL